MSIRKRLLITPKEKKYVSSISNKVASFDESTEITLACGNPRIEPLYAGVPAADGLLMER